jgi:predicted nucleic-acid-binding Zn-ribbon protein
MLTCPVIQESYRLEVKMSCPKCGWSPYSRDEDYKIGGPVLRKVTNVDAVPGDINYQTWTEHYKCPKCKTEFTEENGT